MHGAAARSPERILTLPSVAMTATKEQIEFILKWEAEVQRAEAQWRMACKFGGSGELIEGARMQGTSKMLEEAYDALKIMPQYIRKCGKDVIKKWEESGYVHPTQPPLSSIEERMEAEAFL